MLTAQRLDLAVASVGWSTWGQWLGMYSFLDCGTSGNPTPDTKVYFAGLRQLQYREIKPMPNGQRLNQWMTTGDSSLQSWVHVHAG